MELEFVGKKYSTCVKIIIMLMLIIIIHVNFNIIL